MRLKEVKTNLAFAFVFAAYKAGKFTLDSLPNSTAAGGSTEPPQPDLPFTDQPVQPESSSKRVLKEPPLGRETIAKKSKLGTPVHPIKNRDSVIRDALVVREVTRVTMATQDITHELQLVGMKLSIGSLVQLHLCSAACNYLYRQYRAEIPQHLVNLPPDFTAHHPSKLFAISIII